MRFFCFYYVCKYIMVNFKLINNYYLLLRYYLLLLLFTIKYKFIN